MHEQKNGRALKLFSYIRAIVWTISLPNVSLLIFEIFMLCTFSMLHCCKGIRSSCPSHSMCFLIRTRIHSRILHYIARVNLRHQRPYQMQTNLVSLRFSKTCWLFTWTPIPHFCVVCAVVVIYKCHALYSLRLLYKSKGVTYCTVLMLA